MELWCRGRLVARVIAPILETALVRAYEQPQSDNLWNCSASRHLATRPGRTMADCRMRRGASGSIRAN